MATLPPEQPDMMAGQGQPEPEPQAQEGYTICIAVAGDGSLSVGTEGAPEGYKPAANIKDALTIALGIYKADGQPMDDEADEEAFTAGLGARSAP